MGIEGSISVVDLISRSWDCIAPHGSYVYKLEENVDALRTTITELKELRNDVKRKVDIAEEQGLKRLDQVQGWLSRVEIMEVEVEQLVRDASQEIEKKCLGGCCPKNCKTSYKLGKTVAKKLKEVADLKSRGDFVVVADEQPLSLVYKRPSEPIVGLESTFDEVWSCIEDERTGIIGLYGVGGVGKTTLLTQINNKLFNTTHGFDKVIWTVVSNNPNTVKIQEDIGKKIGFNDGIWNEKSQEEKALDIFGVLSQKKFVLLLDDVWERFDLSNMGVPLPNEENKSKVVFTTRSEDVCGHMEVHKKIKVKSLIWEEAWDLFQKKVGVETINFLPEITELGKTVARECDGLPLALITIGRALACKKTPQEWRHAITMLKKSTAEFSGMGDKVYSRLKFSYDYLQSDAVRSCFLYCSLFPEDHSISKRELIEYWISEGFLDGFNNSNEAKNWGYDIIGTLIRACLLEEDSSLSVKMHDVIRDMALWIACECGKVKNKILVQTGADLLEAPEIAKWNGVKRMSLMHNNIRELTGTPSCPDLLTLFLNNNILRRISHGFFQNMPNLKVLDLSKSAALTKLPEEISKLVSLQHLNLASTWIRKFPVEFKNLVELKYLDLTHTFDLDIIPPGVLSSFKKLRVLKMDGCGSSDSSAKDCRFEASLKEFECLENLYDFSINICTTSALSSFLSSPKLLSFTTRLNLQFFKPGVSKYLDVSFLESITSLNDVQFQGCNGLEGMENAKIISRQGFHSIRNMDINCCPKLKELTWLAFAPNLENLKIWGCDSLEEVICVGKLGAAEEDEGHLNLFAKLQTLELWHLQLLKSICLNALPFPCLNSIEVLYCQNLKKLPFDSSSAKGRGLVIRGLKNWWNGLEWEDEATQNAFLTSFKWY